MSKERELLERWLDDTIFEPEELDSLMEETRELLAQPEQKREPIDTRRITLEMFSDGVDINYKNGYVAGIKFAEKMHGIGGGE
jgi:hypothetical protein